MFALCVSFSFARGEENKEALANYFSVVRARCTKDGCMQVAKPTAADVSLWQTANALLYTRVCMYMCALRRNPIYVQVRVGGVSAAAATADDTHANRKVQLTPKCDT